MSAEKDKKITFQAGVMRSQAQLLNSMANYLLLLQEQLDTTSKSIGAVLESHAALKLVTDDEKEDTQ